MDADNSQRDQLVVALDVGGTDIKGAIVGEGGIVELERWPTRASEGPQAAIDAVLDATLTLLARTDRDHCAGIGLAVPGTMDEETGLVTGAENLGWVNLPLRGIVESAVGMPVHFGHDVRTAGLAEWHVGAGKGRDNLVYLSVGTGIAAAIVVDGRMIRGGGFAGEVGHNPRPGGGPCACEGVGCPETFASAAGMARRYREITGIEVPGSRELLERAASGDEVAREVWAAGVDCLGEIISSCVRVLGETYVIIGGGLVGAGQALLAPLREATDAGLTIHPKPPIVPARLGSKAGVYGAAYLAWQAAGLPVPQWKIEE